MMDGRVSAAESQTQARATKEVALRPVDRQGWARCMSAANCLQTESRQCEMSAMGQHRTDAVRHNEDYFALGAPKSKIH
jgi:hypothetical protein